MFQVLQLEVMERFTAVEQYFRESRRFPKGKSPSQTVRGLIFVQIYAIYEYTVQRVVQAATDEIISHAHSYADLRPSLLAIFLDPEFNSLQAVSLKKTWDRRLQLLDRATCNKPLETTSVIPADGSHFRQSQLKLILRVLGVTRKPTVRTRHLYKIDEVVEMRNAIAHGRETAAAVGQRYTRRDIYRIIRQVKAVCLRLIMIVSEHCSDPSRQRR
jgi:hypothetical protein